MVAIFFLLCFDSSSEDSPSLASCLSLFLRCASEGPALSTGSRSRLYQSLKITVRSSSSLALCSQCICLLILIRIVQFNQIDAAPRTPASLNCHNVSENIHQGFTPALTNQLSQRKLPENERRISNFRAQWQWSDHQYHFVFHPRPFFVRQLSYYAASVAANPLIHSPSIPTEARYHRPAGAFTAETSANQYAV